MNILSLTIICIAIITALACALPGVFLVLRGVALMSDAVSHAILLGIVVMFLIVQRLDSPLLFIGASLAGLITVICTEQLMKVKYIKKDAAIGLVFPLFFSVAIILISLFARNVHLDTDMVLLGELAFAPFNRLFIAGLDLGPIALWTMSVMLLSNVLLLIFFYKELTLSLFDADFSTTLKKSPAVFYYGLMLCTSVTAVGAFDVVGSLVVVALMIVPAATASLLAYRLMDVIIISLIIAASGAVGGYGLAVIANASIAGCISVVLGLFFLIVLFGAPTRGLWSKHWYAQKVQQDMKAKILCQFLKSNPSKELSIEHISRDLGWSLHQTKQVCRYAADKRLIAKGANTYQLIK